MAGSAPLPAQPVAYFVADRYSEHAGDADRFAAVPGPVPASSYSWAFDDGAIASGIAVSHSFESPGLHRVTLTASGAAGSSTYRASVNVVPAGSDANIPCGQVAGEAAAAPTYAVAGTAPRAAVHGTRAGLPNTSAAPYVPGMPLPLIAPVAVAAWRLRRLLARRGQPAAKA
jgi:hypothetical protein